MMISSYMRRVFLCGVLVFGALMAHVPLRASSFSSFWRSWYNFRKEHIYPLNNLGLLVSTACGAPMDFVGALRHEAGYSNVPEVYDTGYPFITARFGVGIIDAWLAQKPTAQIVEEDVAGFVSYVGVLVAIDSLFPELLRSSGITVPRALRENSLVRAIALYTKSRIASMGSKIISKPIGVFAAQMFKSNTKPAHHLQLTVDIDGERYSLQPMA